MSHNQIPPIVIERQLQYGDYQIIFQTTNHIINPKNASVNHTDKDNEYVMNYAIFLIDRHKTRHDITPWFAKVTTDICYIINADELMNGNQMKKQLIYISHDTCNIFYDGDATFDFVFGTVICKESSSIIHFHHRRITVLYNGVYEKTFNVLKIRGCCKLIRSHDIRQMNDFSLRVFTDHNLYKHIALMKTDNEFSFVMLYLICVNSEKTAVREKIIFYHFDTSQIVTCNGRTIDDTINRKTSTNYSFDRTDPEMMKLVIELNCVLSTGQNKRSKALLYTIPKPQRHVQNTQLNS